MEDLLHDFLLNYFQCSLNQRNFEDHCRQLSRHNGPVPERKQLLDECLKDANSVSAGYSELESCANKLLAIMQEQDHRDDAFMSSIAEALSYCQADKAMADDFSLGVLSKQIGQKRTPMTRPIVNPFIPLVEEETEEVAIEEPESEESAKPEEDPEEETAQEELTPEIEKPHEPEEDEE